MGELIMNRLYVYIAALTAVVAIGCTKEENETCNPLPDNGGEKITVDFISSMESGYLTRTAIGTEEGVRSVNWTEGDKVRILSSDGSSVETGISVDGEIADVTLMQSSTYYAVYPADTDTDYGVDGISFTVPDLQNGKFEEANYMMGATSDDVRNFRFLNMVSMLQIDVDSKEYDKIVIRSNDGSPLVGRQTVQMDSEGSIVSIAASEGSAQIELVPEGEGPFYVAMLADTKLPAGLGFRFYKDGEPVSGALSVTPLSAERSSIRTLKPDAQVVTDWYIAPDGTGNGLSENTPGGPKLLSSLLSLNVADGVVNEGYTNAWRIDEATIHLAEGTYTTTGLLLGFKEAVSFKVVAPEDGNTVLTVQDGSIITLDSENCKASFSNIGFSGGKAADNGGAVLMTAGCEGSILEFSNCTFSENVAGDKSKTTKTDIMLGGAIHLENGEVHFNQCIFDGNTANLGAHISMKSANPKVFINRSVFKNATACHQKGDWLGAAINSANTKAVLCMNNCIFYNNASPNTTTNEGLPCIRTNGVKTLIMNTSFAHKGIRTLNAMNGDNGGHALILNNISKNLGSRSIEVANGGTRKYNLTITNATDDDTDIGSNDNLTINWTEETNLFTWELANVSISNYATVSAIEELVKGSFADFDTWLKTVDTDPYGIDYYGNKRNAEKLNPGAWDEGLN